MTTYREASASEELKNKRQQILEAAYVVFSKKGYHRATVDEIIALADTGKGTVYNYFNNKEQLFYTLIQEISEPFEASLKVIVDSEQLPLVKIKQLIKLFLEFYVKNADLWRVMMHEVRGFGSESLSLVKPELREKYMAHFTDTTGTFQTVLDEAAANGDIKPIDKKKIAFGLFSVIVTMVFQKLVGDDIDAAAEQVANIFLYGIAK